MVKRKDNPNQRSLFDIKALRILEEDKDKKITRVVGSKTEEIDLNVNNKELIDEDGFNTEEVNKKEQTLFDEENKQEIYKIFFNLIKDEDFLSDITCKISEKVSKDIESKYEHILPKKYNRDYDNNIIYSCNKHHNNINNNFKPIYKNKICDLIIIDDNENETYINFDSIQEECKFFEVCKSNDIKMFTLYLENREVFAVMLSDIMDKYMEILEDRYDDISSEGKRKTYKKLLESYKSNNYKGVIDSFVTLALEKSLIDREKSLSGSYKVENNLKNIIRQSPYVQEEVARIVGISSKTLSNIIANKNTSLEVALKLSELFNIPVNELFKLVKVEEDETLD